MNPGPGVVPLGQSCPLDWRLRNLENGQLQSGKDTLARELRDSCTFHEHSDVASVKLCKQSQLKDAPFYSTFSSAYMEPVYRYGEKVKAQDQTQE